MSAPEIAVEQWGDLLSLPEVMDVLGGQLDQIAEHLDTWMCNDAGFEPSPVCLLRPLGALLRLVADGFAEVKDAFDAQWAADREGVVTATELLRGEDVRVDGTFDRRRADLGRVA